MKKLLVISFFTLHFSLFTNLCKAQIISTVAGNGILGYGGDGGPATAAELNSSFGIFTSVAGNLYIADNQNHRARLVDGSGNINTFAGTGVSGLSGNGGPATAADLGNPADVIMDTAGNIYVVDFGNNDVREVHTAGLISTFAGNGAGGFSGDGGAARTAELSNCCGLAIDLQGNIYISDRGNNRVRRVDTAGIITTYAGNGSGGYAGDGGLALAAELNGSNGIFMDAGNNLYIADYLNNRVRKVAPDSIITTIAGNGIAAYSGDGGLATAAETYEPMGVAADAAGNVYIADHGESRIREIMASDTMIYTVAGNGVNGFSGDGGPATAAEIFAPSGVCLDNSGNIYITDQGNSRVRKVTGAVTNINTISVRNNVAVYPNPSNGQFTLQINNSQLTIDNENTQIQIYNILGEQVYSTKVSLWETLLIVHPGSYRDTWSIDLSSQPNGIYIYRVIAENGEMMGEGKLVIQK
jgi:trimeric autotransporter adhesin